MGFNQCPMENWFLQMLREKRKSFYSQIILGNPFLETILKTSTIQP